MKKIEETFMENRESDWLASEMKRERRNSAWGFDDSRKYEKDRHEEDCEREEVAREHAEAHERYARANNLPYNQVHARTQSTSTVRTSTGKKNTSNIPKIIFAVYMIIFLIIALVFVLVFSSIAGFGDFGYGRPFSVIFSLIPNAIFMIIFISVISAIVKSFKSNSRK